MSNRLGYRVNGDSIEIVESLGLQNILEDPSYHTFLKRGVAFSAVQEELAGKGNYLFAGRYEPEGTVIRIIAFPAGQEKPEGYGEAYPSPEMAYYESSQERSRQQNA